MPVSTRGSTTSNKRPEKEPLLVDDDDATASPSSGAAPEAKKRRRSVSKKHDDEQEQKKEADINKDQSEKDNVESKEQTTTTATTTKTTDEAASTSPSTANAGETKYEKEDLVVYERGHIHFFFRTKINAQEAEGLNDVARLYIVLQPDITNKQLQKESDRMQHPCRMLIVGKKQLPDFDKHAGFWSFIDYIDRDYDKVMEQLQAKQYETATRGPSHVPPAHAVGHGVYVLATHKNKHSHLVYVLEQPEQPNEAQVMFHIGKEGSYIIQLKNPQYPLSEKEKAIGLPHVSADQTAAQEKPLFKEEVQQKAFGKGDYQLRWAMPYPIDLLNSSRAELLIIPAKEDIVAELGQLGVEMELLARDEKLPNMGEVIEDLRQLGKEQQQGAKEETSSGGTTTAQPSLTESS